MGTMSKKLFSPEEIAAFKANPHIRTATERSVTFTPQFKRMAYRELLEGKHIHDILEDHGIDTSVLGEARISSILMRLRQFGERDEGFTDLRHQRKGKSPEDRNQSTEKRIRQLEAELAYTKQVVEFLKKVQAADTEARKAWESKHRPQ